MVKVSIVVPVYNTGEYIDKCIESIMNQTFQDFEVIIIDDGSTDGSKEKIKNYSEKYDKIRSYFQENKGRAKTRNLLLEHVDSEYICFVDSDDYIEKNYIEKLYNKIISDNYDVVISNYYILRNNKKEKIPIGIRNDLCTKEEVRNNMYMINTVLWNKMYCTKLIKQIKFNEELFFEDVDFWYRLYCKFSKIGIVNDYLYNYNVRNCSATNTFDERWYNLENSMNITIDYYKNNGLYEEYKDELEYLYIKYMLGTLIKNIAKSKKYNELKISREYVRNLILKKFPQYKKNKYIKKLSLKNIYFKHFNFFVWLIYRFY